MCTSFEYFDDPSCDLKYAVQRQTRRLLTSINSDPHNSSNADKRFLLAQREPPTLACIKSWVINPSEPPTLILYTNVGAGMCVDITGGQYTNGNPLQQWTCNHTPAQNFQVICLLAYMFIGADMTADPFRTYLHFFPPGYPTYG